MNKTACNKGLPVPLSFARKDSFGGESLSRIIGRLGVRFKMFFLFAIVASNIAHAQNTFTNPIKQTGPDPWVIYKNGWYYYMNTIGGTEGEDQLKIWRTKNMAQL